MLENKTEQGKRIYIFLQVFMVSLSCLSIISAWKALRETGSLMNWMVNNIPTTERFFCVLQKGINIDTVTKIGDAVGICSIILTWIFTSLDKKELGFRYSEILQEEICPRYHGAVLVQLGDFLLCVWTAQMEKLEPAVLALLAVLVGSILQWFALKDLILLAEKRRVAAEMRWRRLIKKADEAELEEIIYRMMKELAADVEDGYKRMESLLVTAIGKYIESVPLNEVDWRYAIRNVATMWEYLLQEKAEGERGRLVMSVLEESRGQPWLGVLCAAYFLYFHDRHMVQSSESELFAKDLIKERDLLAQRFIKEENESKTVSFYATTISTMMLTMYHMCQWLGWNSEWLVTKSCEGDEQDKAIIKSLLEVVFKGDTCENYFEGAWQLVFRSIESDEQVKVGVGGEQ